MTTSVTTFENVSRDILRDSVTNNDFHVQNLSRDSVTPRVTDKGGIFIYPQLSRHCHEINKKYTFHNKDEEL